MTLLALEKSTSTCQKRKGKKGKKPKKENKVAFASCDFLAAFRTSEPHSCPRLGNSPWSCSLALHKHRNFHGK